MKALRILILVTVWVCGGAAWCAEAGSQGEFMRSCIDAAARLHGVPPDALLILLDVEGGRLGEVSPNRDKNGEITSVDIGPMQVNDSWLPKIAARWRASKGATYLALRDEFCANVEGGAWILGQALAEANGDLWEAMGVYHSHTEKYKQDYLRLVLAHGRKLQKKALER